MVETLRWVNGWAEVLRDLGDINAGTAPTLFIHKRCARLIETLPALRHDPSQPEDVLKVDADEDGVGGDDTEHALRYMVAAKGREIEGAVGGMIREKPNPLRHLRIHLKTFCEVSGAGGEEVKIALARDWTD
jgi:hypothetical protein